jgi:hypothetical protein
MSEPSEEGEQADDDDGSESAGSAGNPGADVEALRERVEQEYDFDDFGPQEMAEMSPEEWEAVFDSDAWITGEELLDRVEADLRSRIADRDVFAVVERTVPEDPKLVAYSDRSYAVVYPDGSIEGEGAVLRDVKPTVALASMPDYEVPEPPEEAGLPAPDAVDDGSSRLGNWMLQFVAGALALAGLVLLGGGLLGGLGSATIVAATIGVVFLLVGGALLFAVANARLSSRYRAEEYRTRLRGAGVGGERPEFLPVDETAFRDGPELESGRSGQATSDGDGEESESSDDEADSEPESRATGDGEQ